MIRCGLELHHNLFSKLVAKYKCVITSSVLAAESALIFKYKTVYAATIELLVK